MTGSEYTVGIVVDATFGERLHALMARMPTWIADTPLNRAAAEAHWRTHPGEAHTNGITTFRVDAARAPEDWCAGILGAVIEHHGEHSHSPPVSVLEVIGAQPLKPLVGALGDYGFTQVEPYARGFPSPRRLTSECSRRRFRLKEHRIVRDRRSRRS